MIAAYLFDGCEVSKCKTSGLIHYWLDTFFSTLSYFLPLAALCYVSWKVSDGKMAKKTFVFPPSWHIHVFETNSLLVSKAFVPFNIQTLNYPVKSLGRWPAGSRMSGREVNANLQHISFDRANFITLMCFWRRKMARLKGYSAFLLLMRQILCNILLLFCSNTPTSPCRSNEVNLWIFTEKVQIVIAVLKDYIFHKGPYIKYDRIFWPFLPPPPSDYKMT